MEIYNPRAVLRRISERLVPRFYGVFPAETVERFVIESHHALAERARVRDHRPTLAGKLAENRQFRQDGSVDLGAWGVHRDTIGKWARESGVPILGESQVCLAESAIGVKIAPSRATVSGITR